MDHFWIRVPFGNFWRRWLAWMPVCRIFYFKPVLWLLCCFCGFQPSSGAKSGTWNAPQQWNYLCEGKKSCKPQQLLETQRQGNQQGVEWVQGRMRVICLGSFFGVWFHPKVFHGLCLETFNIWFWKLLISDVSTGFHAWFLRCCGTYCLLWGWNSSNTYMEMETYRHKLQKRFIRWSQN